MSPQDTATVPRPLRGVSRAFPGTAAQRVLYITDFYLEETLLGIVDYAWEAEWDLIANMRFHGLFPSERHADGVISTVNTARVRMAGETCRLAHGANSHEFRKDGLDCS